jgi:hypothetical protein
MNKMDNKNQSLKNTLVEDILTQNQSELQQQFAMDKGSDM